MQPLNNDGTKIGALSVTLRVLEVDNHRRETDRWSITYADPL